MSDWFYRPGAAASAFLLRMLGKPTVSGLENVPRQGPFILVANHVSLADPPIIGWAAGYLTNRIIHFMAKQEVRGWPILGWLAARSGVFFVRRGEGDRASQRDALAMLARGEPIALFPEGTRSRTGVLGDAKAGAALLAMRSGAPLLPVAISGSERIFPGKSRMPHRTDVSVQIGEPFSLPHQPDGRLDREVLARGSDEIMRRIAALLPPAQRGRHG